MLILFISILISSSIIWIVPPTNNIGNVSKTEASKAKLDKANTLSSSFISYLSITYLEKLITDLSLIFTPLGSPVEPEVKII